MRWSRALIDAVLDELYVNEQLDELLENASNNLRVSQFAQAVAVETAKHEQASHVTASLGRKF